jgi:hypothetical protein
MAESRELCDSTNPVAFMRGAVLALLLTVVAGGCEGGGKVNLSNKPDAGVKRDASMGEKEFIEFIRKAVRESWLKDGGVDEGSF